MKKSIILLYFILISSFFQGQEKNIQYVSGKVFEISNQTPLATSGVNIRFLSSNSGTQLTLKEFKLQYTSSEKQLIFSYAGYLTDTLEIKDNKELRVVMSEGKILEDLVVEFKKGSYRFSKIDPRNVHTIGQDELRKATCCNLAESFETNPSIDATFTDAITEPNKFKCWGLQENMCKCYQEISCIRGLSTLYGLKQIRAHLLTKYQCRKAQVL